MPPSDPVDVANNFSDYFTNIGPSLSSKISPTNSSPNERKKKKKKSNVNVPLVMENVIIKEAVETKILISTFPGNFILV